MNVEDAPPAAADQSSPRGANASADEVNVVGRIMSQLGVSEEEATDIARWQSSGPAPASDEPECGVDFLCHCFPAVPRTTVERVYAESGKDTATASDQLLNLELIQGSCCAPEPGNAQRVKERNERADRLSEMKIASMLRDIDFLASTLSLDVEAAENLYERGAESVQGALSYYSAHPREFGAWPRPKSANKPKTTAHAPANSRQKLLVRRAATPPAARPPAHSVEVQPMSLPEMDRHYRRVYEAEVQRGSSHSRCAHTAFLAGEARAHAAAARQKLAELKALRVRVHAQRGARDFADFHGMTTNTALAYCQHVLENWEDTGSSELKLVTGAGWHSRGHVPRVKNAVKSLLDSRGYEYDEDEGSFTVYKAH